MDLWERMMKGVSRIVNGTENQEILIGDLQQALEEEEQLWENKKEFVATEKVDAYKDRWYDLYDLVDWKRKTFLYNLGFFDKDIRILLENFWKQYSIISDTMHEHNTKVAKKMVSSVRDIIGLVEGRALDEQQLLCIAKDVRNHLVLAGAGTGKTTTIIGYVKYLLLSKKCKAEDILLLSFTNASATEMAERVHKETGYNLDVFTFHKLGLNIMTEVLGKKPKITSLDMMRFIRSQIAKEMSRTEYLKKLLIYIAFGMSNAKSEFDFSNKRECEEYLKWNPPITLLKENVKSYGEKDIANFLFQNGIQYIYEYSYPVDTNTSDYGQYHPDFYLPEYDIYIEYYGINRSGDVPEYFESKDGKSAKECYHEGMKWKRELHKENNTKLIETFAYEKMENNLLENLETKLKNAGVKFKPLDSQKMWDRVSGGDKELDRLTELFNTVIELVKNNNISFDELRMRNKEIANNSLTNILIELIEPIYNQYELYLHANKEIDFNDMINTALDYVRTGKYQHNYKYVIVDEYQDIAQARYNLLYEMRMQRDYNLFCVGDDWQSIYRFNGSDVGFILDFDKYWGMSEISRIETTYRFPQSLIQISGNFVMKNPRQKVKELKSYSKEEIFSLDEITAYNEQCAVDFLKKRLDDLPRNSSILFLGRYRFDIQLIKDESDMEYHYNNATGDVEVRYSKRTDLKIVFKTAHGSKGLQSDYVFILNTKRYGMGFPSQIADPPILKLLLDNCDDYLYAEERRLFYVALTRAKKKVWLIVIQGNESIFVEELEKKYATEMKAARYACPACGGKMVKRSGKYGDFYGCVNYNKNGCNYTRKMQ